MSSPKKRAVVPDPTSFCVIESLQPTVDGGRFPAKAVAGDPTRISAVVFTHGHDLVRALVRHRRAGTPRWQSTPMTALGNDRFEATIVPSEPGRLEVEVIGEVDHLATWCHDAARRTEAGTFDPNDPLTGAALVREAARRLGGRRGRTKSDDAEGGGAPALRELAGQLRQVGDAVGLGSVLAELEALEGVLAERSADMTAAATAQLELAVQRELAACSAWYECFPRSTSPDPTRPGTLVDLIDRLDYIAGLGFDVVYLPPIHPIGRTARKGPNNDPEGGPDAVGSPWAIGAAEGGHTAIAPELGTLEDFDLLVSEAARHGLEIALDVVFGCSPDHPWVREHPEWFAHRPDGTIACAENPPKRYEDVYPLDFSTPDRDGLYRALLDVVRFWMGHGVRAFRVDNPHTKPFEFWEWLLATIHAEDPGVVFLSEAFTRPAVMHRLAKLGFDQSYTYFTWRYTGPEIEDYLSELAHGPGATYLRGNCWPNTPDILAQSLQHGGRPSFVVRLLLAACGSSNYGIYGPVFELLEDRPVRPGSEEYLDSEKYEVRHFDLDDPRSIAPVIRRVNAARRLHPALRRNSSLRFHGVDNPQLCCFSKRDEQSGDTVICVVNLDPNWPQSGFVDLDLTALGLQSGAPYVMRDLLADHTYTWTGGRNFVLLDPSRDNAHLFVVEAPVARRGR